MSRIALVAKKVITPDTVIPQGVVLVDGRKILEVGPRSAVVFHEEEFEVFHFENETLVPGFIDVHIHGACGHDVMEATREAMTVVSRHLARHGTTSYLATTVTAPPIETIQAVESLGQLITEDTGGARILGLHLEGPFISQEKRGVHPPEHIRLPSTGIFDELVKMSGGQVRLITVAPELPGGLEFIEHIRSRGVLVSVGHSNATYEVARQAIRAGASNATHTFNAMRDFSHRETGVIGAVLTDSTVWAELIADGVHVDPVAIQMLLRCKGPRRILLVTDAISAAGMPDGDYRVGTLSVKVSQGVCRASNGALAGSTLSLDRALRNMIDYTGIPLEEAVYMTSRNPAESIGVAESKGSIRPGCDADLVLLDNGLLVQATFCEGKLVFREPEHAAQATERSS
ncbi:MAG: N-acetylglucosamine-6-phosphate deacetylase [Acidimicrobiia bacterium]|nr:N-acetylglucosamine-6-phosphate deacetylase [Acidimicrobiia bacterium]